MNNIYISIEIHVDNFMGTRRATSFDILTRFSFQKNGF